MSEPEQNAVVVFLLVYSGRPNPSWPLDQGGVAEVATRLAEARGRALRVPPPQARLGYQGFRIENRPGVDGLPPMLLVGGGAIVEATEKGDGEPYEADLADERDRTRRVGPGLVQTERLLEPLAEAPVDVDGSDHEEGRADRSDELGPAGPRQHPADRVPPAEARGIVAVAAAVEERLRQPPERVGDEATDEQHEERPRPAMRREDAKRALRVGRLPAVAERELQREDGDGREANALSREPEPSQPADPLATSGAPGRYVRSSQRARFLTSLRALPAACWTFPFAAVAAPLFSVVLRPVS